MQTDLNIHLIPESTNLSKSIINEEASIIFQFLSAKELGLSTINLFMIALFS